MATYSCFVLASPALKGVGLQVCNGNESTDVADVHTVGVRGSKQSLVEKLCGTVSYLTVSLHLSESQTSITADMPMMHDIHVYMH